MAFKKLKAKKQVKVEKKETPEIKEIKKPEWSAKIANKLNALMR